MLFFQSTPHCTKHGFSKLLTTWESSVGSQKAWHETANHVGQAIFYAIGSVKIVLFQQGFEVGSSQKSPWAWSWVRRG